MPTGYCVIKESGQVLVVNSDDYETHVEPIILYRLKNKTPLGRLLQDIYDV